MATVKSINGGQGQFTVAGNIGTIITANVDGNGNSGGGNIYAGVPADGNVLNSSGYLFGNGFYLTGVGNGGGGGGGTNYSNANALSYLAVFPGNIIPSGTGQTLGNASNPWQTLYVSGNTIVIGTANLTTANSQLFVSGQQVLTSNVANANLVFTGNIFATGNIQSDGNIIASNALGNQNGYFFGNGYYLTQVNGSNVVGGYGNANVAAYLPTYGGNLQGGNITVGGEISGGYLSISGNSSVGNIFVNGGGNGLTQGTVVTRYLGVGDIYNPISGNIQFNTATLANIGAPFNPSDAATKAYVDQNATGLQIKATVYLASNVAITSGTATYNNGTGGVGATITGTTNGGLVVDGVNTSTLSVGTRILIKDEVGGQAPWNGIYTVTTPGSVSAAFVLTRSADMNNPTEFPNAYTLVKGGDTNEGTGWVCTNSVSSPPTIGTTPITFVEFTSTNIYNAGNGLSENNNIFSLNVDTRVNAGLIIDNNIANTNTYNTLVTNPIGNIYTGNIFLAGNIVFPAGDPSADIVNINNFDAVNAEIENLIVSPLPSSISIPATQPASGNGTFLTITFASQAPNIPFPPGQLVVLTGFDTQLDEGFNGEYVVATGNSTTVTVPSSLVGTSPVVGAIQTPPTRLGNIVIDASGNMSGLANTTVTSGAVNNATLAFYSGYDLSNPLGPQPLAPPSTANSPGITGSIRFDATHIYVCIADNTWIRAAAATW